MAQIHKELRKKEPTSLHTDLTKYIKATTGYEADVQTVKLALLLAPVYRNSEENVARRNREQAAKDKAEQARLDEIAAKKQAVVDRKAAVKAERAERLRAQLAALESDDDDSPAPRKLSSPVTKGAAKAAKSAPAKPVKRVAKVVPIKRAAKPAAEPTPERGQVRESDGTEAASTEDGWDDGEIEPY